jgi:hypothetical protein
MGKSFISDLRIFFNTLFYVFFPLGLYIIYTGFKSDAVITVENSFQDNLEKIQYLEQLRLSSLEELKTALQQKLKINTTEQLIFVRNNASRIRNEVLAERIYSPAEFSDPDQMVLILPFRMQQQVFRQKSSVLQSFFSSGPPSLSELHLSMIRQEGLPTDFTDTIMSGFNKLMSPVSALDIFTGGAQTPFLQRPDRYGLGLDFHQDVSSRLLSLKTSDWQKLDQLDGNKDLRYRGDEDFNVNWYRILLDVYELSFIHETEGKANLSPSPSARTLAYLIRFLWKEQGNLGLCQFSDHRIWRDGFFYKQEFNRPGSFFQSRVGEKIHSYFWDVFPPDYMERSPDKNEFPIFPQEMLGGLIDEVLLGHYLLKNLVIRNEPDFNFFISQKAKPGETTDSFLKSAHFQDKKWSENNGELNFLPLESLKYWDSSSRDFIDLKINPASELSQLISKERELALQWQDKNGQLCWGSAIFSLDLGNAFIILYQPAKTFLMPFYRKWLLTILLYLCSIPVFLLVRNRFLSGFKQALNQCIEFCALPETMDLRNHKTPALSIFETALLVRKMSEFNQAIAERFLQIQLVFGFQNILNQPNKSFTYYKEEFFYFLRDLGGRFKWRFLSSNQIENLKNDSIYKLNFSSEHLDYLKNNQKLNGPFALQFLNRNLPSKWEKQLIGEYFVKMTEKSRLEESFLRHRILQQDLELSKPVLSALLPAEREWQQVGIFVSVKRNEEQEPGGEFAELQVGKRGLCFCFCSPTMKGLGAGLFSSCLKAFWQCCKNESEKPEQLLLKCHEFICKRGFGDYFSGLISGFIDTDKNILYFASAGLPIFKKDITGNISILPPDCPPLGFSSLLQPERRSLSIGRQEEFYLISGLVFNQLTSMTEEGFITLSAKKSLKMTICTVPK